MPKARLLPLVTSLAVCLSFVACGGSTDDGAGTGGSSSGGVSSGGGTSSTGGAAGSAGAPSGPCEPIGSWQIEFGAAISGPSQCKPSAPLVVTVVAGGGGAGNTYVVQGPGESPPNDACTPDGGPGTEKESSSFDETTCTLTYERNWGWCQSGEGQCENISVVLKLAGNQGSGQGEYVRCWCGGGTGGATVTLPATATKL